jgi:hypothetical protein
MHKLAILKELVVGQPADLRDLDWLASLWRR